MLYALLSSINCKVQVRLAREKVLHGALPLHTHAPRRSELATEAATTIEMYQKHRN